MRSFLDILTKSKVKNVEAATLYYRAIHQKIQNKTYHKRMTLIVGLNRLICEKKYI